MSTTPTVDDDFDWENYESGPYCEHWSPPWDCDEACAGCNHRCIVHCGGGGINDTVWRACDMEGCECKAFKSP